MLIKIKAIIEYLFGIIRCANLQINGTVKPISAKKAVNSPFDELLPDIRYSSIVIKLERNIKISSRISRR